MTESASSSTDRLVSFAEMMALEPHGPDTWVGIGPRYPWGGLYGGQIVAQALRAATLSVDPEYRVHSLHAYFIRGGDHTKPIRFEVDRTRDGRSFCTRSVTARQPVGAILSLIASFQVAEDGADLQKPTIDPVLGTPDHLTVDGWSHLFDRAWAPTMTNGSDGVRSACWLRMTESVDDDPAVQACTLAYLSDDIPTDAIVGIHPRFGELRQDGDFSRTFMSASIDHAIYFHRPVDVNEWHVHDMRGSGLQRNRGLSTGEVFAADATHAATVVQEVLLRERR